MKRQNAIPLICAILLFTVCGCAGREIRVAQKTFNETLREIIAARDAGQISDQTQNEIILPAVESTKILLDKMVDSYLRDVPFDWRDALAKVYEAMAPLLRQRTLLETSNAPPIPD